MGIVLLVWALRIALDPNYPIPLDGNQYQKKNLDTASQIPDAELGAPEMLLSVVPGAASEKMRIVLDANFESESWRVVLLDQDLQEIAWSESVSGRVYEPRGSFREAMVAGQSYHLYAVGEWNGRQVRSAANMVNLP